MLIVLYLQAKQLQIDDLLKKVDDAQLEQDRLREEKDQEIAILQEGMDATIQQLHEVQQVISLLRVHVQILMQCAIKCIDPGHCRSDHKRSDRYFNSRQ